jgi:hypothetical protein
VTNPTNAKSTLTGAAVILLLLAAVFWVFSGASDSRRERRTADASPTFDALPALGGPPDSARNWNTLQAVRLDLNLFSVPSPRGRGVPGRPEDYLGTQPFPAPPFPTREQYGALKQAITARLNTVGIRVLLDGSASNTAMGEPAPVFVVTRDVNEANGVTFLLVRVQLQQTLYALSGSGGGATGGPVSATMAGNEAQYVGARRLSGGAQTWRWTEKAVLSAVDQFVARRRFQARYGGEGGIADNAEAFAEYQRFSGTPAAVGPNSRK